MAIWDDMKEDVVFDDEGKVITETTAHVMCPTCAGSLLFDANLEKLACKNCGNLYMPNSLENVGMMDTRDLKEASEEESGKIEFVCDNCGARVVTDDNTAATFCAFCGSFALIKRRLDREFRPDYIIPFKVTKEEAKKKFYEWAKKNKYVPRNFIDEESLEKITGIYVPFWLIDADCHTILGGSGSLIEGNTKFVFTVDREIDFKVRKVPFDGSKKIRNMLMEAVEPFDYSELEPFSSFYLPGYYAQRYDESALDMTQRISSRIDSYARQLGKFITVGEYNETSLTTTGSFSTNFKQAYALFPVWFLKYKYKGLPYDFAVNGQTGEAAGDLPVSEVKRKARIGLEVAKWSALPLAAIVGCIVLLSFIMKHSPGMLLNFLYIVAYAFALIFPLSGYAIYKIKNISFMTTNPIDSAPPIDQYVDFSSKTNMVKNDKMGFATTVEKGPQEGSLLDVLNKIGEFGRGFRRFRL